MRSIKKLLKPIAGALLIACCLLLAGCVGVSWTGQRIMSVSTVRETDLSLSVERFDGGVTYTIRVREGQEAMLAEVELEEGELEISVTDPRGRLCFEAPVVYSSTFGIGLTGPGLYKINITADGFAGEYRFNWGEEGPDIPEPIDDGYDDDDNVADDNGADDNGMPDDDGAADDYGENEDGGFGG